MEIKGLTPRMIVLLALFGAAAVLAGFLTFKNFQVPDERLERVTLADARSFLGAPVYIALRKGLFEKEGLALTIREHASTGDALKALLDGKADFAIAAETPLIEGALKGKKVRILATLASSGTDLAIIHSRGQPFIPKDSAAPYPIGIIPDSGADYFLMLLFLYKGWDSKGVRLIPIERDEVLAALRDKKINAAVLWEPEASMIKRELGGEFTLKHEDGLCTWHWNLVASPETAKNRRATAAKVMRALRAACLYIHRDPEASRRITANYLDLPESSLEPVWHPFKFNLTLTQETLLNIEAQVRWRLTRTAPDRPLNVLNLFDPEPLREMDPEAVTLIRPAS